MILTPCPGRDVYWRSTGLTRVPHSRHLPTHQCHCSGVDWGQMTGKLADSFQFSSLSSLLLPFFYETIVNHLQNTAVKFCKPRTECTLSPLLPTQLSYKPCLWMQPRKPSPPSGLQSPRLCSSYHPVFLSISVLSACISIYSFRFYPSPPCCHF